MDEQLRAVLKSQDVFFPSGLGKQHGGIRNESPPWGIGNIALVLLAQEVALHKAFLKHERLTLEAFTGWRLIELLYIGIPVWIYNLISYTWNELKWYDSLA